MSRSTLSALVVAATCAAALLPAGAAVAGEGAPSGLTLRIDLTGADVPDGGDPNGTGLAVIQLYPDTSEICWDVKWKGLAGTVTAMHVHDAPKGQIGGHAVDLLNGVTISGASGSSDGCKTVEKGAAGPMHAPLPSAFSAHEAPEGGTTIDAIIAEPEQYYLNVHSTAYSKGAIRGQLG